MFIANYFSQPTYQPFLLLWDVHVTSGLCRLDFWKNSYTEVYKTGLFVGLYMCCV